MSSTGVVSQMNRQRQRWLEEAVSSDRGENAGHALLVTVKPGTQEDRDASPESGGLYLSQ